MRTHLASHTKGFKNSSMWKMISYDGSDVGGCIIKGSFFVPSTLNRQMHITGKAWLQQRLPGKIVFLTDGSTPEEIKVRSSNVRHYLIYGIMKAKLRLRQWCMNTMDVLATYERHLRNYCKLIT